MMSPTRFPGMPEFVTLIALLISLVALTIDAMLPAMPHIGEALNVARANDTQFIVSFFFIGFAGGQLFFGPISDSLGRKNTIIGGLLIYGAGCALSIFATEYWVMLAGRILQGLGAAAPRTVTIAVVRDRYAGREMAKIMSIIMSVFIIVPALAPFLGQAVLEVSGWRMIFVCLVVIAITAVLWMMLRLPETLDPEKRLPLEFGKILAAFGETIRNRIALGYTIAAGFIFGAFLGYLKSAQQVFQDVFGVGDLFPTYFAAMALSLGAASIVNSQLVMRLGMRFLSFSAITGLTLLSAAYLFYTTFETGEASLIAFLIWGLSAFFCVGLLFGNLNALAMEPMGHIAGTAASMIGAASTALSLLFSYPIGQAFNGTVIPLVGGFAVLGLCCGLTMVITNKGIRGAD